jgi:hypothetical protein
VGRDAGGAKLPAVAQQFQDPLTPTRWRVLDLYRIGVGFPGVPNRDRSACVVPHCLRRQRLWRDLPHWCEWNLRSQPWANDSHARGPRPGKIGSVDVRVDRCLGRGRCESTVEVLAALRPPNTAGRSPPVIPCLACDAWGKSNWPSSTS